MQNIYNRYNRYNDPPYSNKMDEFLTMTERRKGILCAMMLEGKYHEKDLNYTAARWLQEADLLLRLIRILIGGF